MKRLAVFQTILTVLSVLSWSIAIYALIIFGEARPDKAVGYFRSKGVEVRLHWDPDLTIQLEYLIWACAAISLVNLLVNFYAKTTTRIGFWVNIPLLFVVSLAAGLYIRYVV
ncbi:hypothetical protein G3R49_07695 [Shewanella sp. WXL01]|uniref:Uncharacterized protein n=1 Tax=Shewanella maritima TaxID=2520507 RepID=A0A411PDB1_9GAMM|nr:MULTISPECIES: hypothetical protein [Shewanella]NKF50453.1 hypothetical protein [Shewanella sp. WXL01]QBF81545.1 hypothetical protein EXU30_01630 [Shewanella maritima]